MKVLVLLSGGVDSAVSAYLLKKQGFDIVGAHLRLWNDTKIDNGCNISGNNNEGENKCCGIDAVDDARRLANQIEIPFYVIDARNEFKQKIVDRFISMHRDAITPSPCVWCNINIKFGFGFKKALELGCTHIASGHYVVVKNGSIFRSKDIEKDQSYFMSMVPKSILQRCIFPLGEMIKSDVRKMADNLNIKVAQKPDSKGLCFYPEDTPKEFLKRWINEDIKEGNFILDRKVVGRHTGLQNYTIGSRRGLGIGGMEKPIFVKNIDRLTNNIELGHEEDLYLDEVNLKDFEWKEEISNKDDLFVKLRHRNKPLKTKIGKIEDNKVKLLFEENKPWGVAPGQHAVIYQNDLVVATGEIY